MFYLGCDVGSLTAKAVILNGDTGDIIASALMSSQSTGKKSNELVIQACLEKAGMTIDGIQRICSTGYGCFENPYETDEMSEISCHGMGVSRLCPEVRTVIDIGGQDSKVIAVDDQGLVRNFRMNNKCAAGTGRILEVLADRMGMTIEEMGRMPLKRRPVRLKPVTISNRCGIFMEIDVVKHLRAGVRNRDIVYAIADAVSHRLAQLTASVGVTEKVAMSGGVSKNRSLVRRLEQILGISFVDLPYDAQYMGALGAAVFAQREEERAGHGK